MIGTPFDSSLARLQAAPQPNAKVTAASGASLESAKRAGQEFEALFISEMLGPVFESLSSDGFFGGGEGEKIYRSLMVQEYGKTIAQAGGVGIAETVQREILKMQENQQ
jgi:Rod binding domain-containing protein